MKCATCPRRETCKTLCKEVKDILKESGIKAVNWIRPRTGDNGTITKEVPVKDIDKVATQRAFQLKSGRRKKVSQQD